MPTHGVGESLCRCCCPGCGLGCLRRWQRPWGGHEGRPRADQASGSGKSSPTVASQTGPQCRLEHAPTITRREPVNRSRRSARPPRSAVPVLTLEQKRYRIERFQVCIKRLAEFDPAKVQRRVGVPEIVTLEAGIDNALSATFGYGTPSYYRFNLAARLDVGPLVSSTALEGTVLRSVGGPGCHDELAAQEAQRYFSEGKARSIALLHEAICTLEAEVSDTRAAVGVTQRSEAAQTADQRNALRCRVRGGFALKAAWHRLGRWWGSR
jgi:hypothetical protein